MGSRIPFQSSSGLRPCSMDGSSLQLAVCCLVLRRVRSLKGAWGPEQVFQGPSARLLRVPRKAFQVVLQQLPSGQHCLGAGPDFQTQIPGWVGGFKRISRLLGARASNATSWAGRPKRRQTSLELPESGGGERFHLFACVACN